LLKTELEKPMQWLVCQLHGNELPLCHLMQHLYGLTHGLRAFSGPIDKVLSKCEQLPVTTFENIEVAFANCEFANYANCEIVNCELCLIVNELSTDQQYVWEITNVVSNGYCPQALPKREPGALNHSRWLTTANRLLRFYVSTEDPSEGLKALAHYVVKVYAPMWFEIKSKPYFSGSSISANAYFSHPKKFLLGMITDERKHIRGSGLRRILKTMRELITRKSVRIFSVPVINCDATDYVELIDWQTTFITEPPLTMHFLDADITSFVARKVSPKNDFQRFPCHIQAVEQCLKLVTEASASVGGMWM